MKKPTFNYRIAAYLEAPRSVDGVPCLLMWLRPATAKQPSLHAVPMKDALPYPKCNYCGFRYNARAASDERPRDLCRVCAKLLRVGKEPYKIVIDALRGVTPGEVTYIT